MRRKRLTRYQVNMTNGHAFANSITNPDLLNSSGAATNKLLMVIENSSYVRERQADKWITVQEKTFTNWINSHLKCPRHRIVTLSRDLCNGVTLIDLIEVLRLKKIEHAVPSPRNRLEMVQNVGLAFNAIAEDNIKLVNIGSEDVVNGNLKLILGLLWHLVLRYQISPTRTNRSSPRKLMLTWLKVALPDVTINNFTTDWNDGIILHYLLDHCDPGLSPNWRYPVKQNNSVENCREAMMIATVHFGIPRVISPEDFASENLDALSTMTYLSYFTMVSSPGYNRSLNWARMQLKNMAINNLTSDWNDGYYLCAIAVSLGAYIPGWPHLDRNDYEGNCQRGLDAVRSLGVDPVLSAIEMAAPTVDHLAIMACLAGLMNIKLLRARIDESIKPNRKKVSFMTKGTATDVNDGRLQVNFTPGQSYPVYQNTAEMDTDVMAYVIKRDVIAVQNTRCAFPRAERRSMMSATKLMTADVRVTTYGDGLSFGHRGEAARFNVTSAHDRRLDVTVDDGLGSAVKCHGTKQSDGSTEYVYVPDSTGTYHISIMSDGHHVVDSPFSVAVTDISKVLMLDDIADWTDDNDHVIIDYRAETCLQFTTDGAGPGGMAAEVLGPSGRITVDITKENNKISLKFTATEEGDHYIHVYWSDSPVPGSPFLAFCPGPKYPIDAIKVTIRGRGYLNAKVLIPAKFIVDGTLAGPGVPNIQLHSINSDALVSVKRLPYDRYACSYTVEKTGGYLLYVQWSGKQVTGSPFKVNITNRGDSEKVSVSGEGLQGGFSGMEMRVSINTTLAGPGELIAKCVGRYKQNTRCVLKDRGNGIWTAHLYPSEAHPHILHILYDGQHVPGSPFTLKVIEPPDPSKVQVSGPGVEDGIIQTFQSRFIVETKGAGAGQLIVRVRGPRDRFKVDMQRMSRTDRSILCQYDPQDPGAYTINVKWSGYHVPGSPFSVNIFETLEELHNHLEQKGRSETETSNSTYRWQEDI